MSITRNIPTSISMRSSDENQIFPPLRIQQSMQVYETILDNSLCIRCQAESCREGNLASSYMSTTTLPASSCRSKILAFTCREFDAPNKATESTQTLFFLLDRLTILNRHGYTAIHRSFVQFSDSHQTASHRRCSIGIASIVAAASIAKEQLRGVKNKRRSSVCVSASEGCGFWNRR